MFFVNMFILQIILPDIEMLLDGAYFSVLKTKPYDHPLRTDLLRHENTSADSFAGVQVAIKY
jgi:hypothetical protein